MRLRTVAGLLAAAVTALACGGGGGNTVSTTTQLDPLKNKVTVNFWEGISGTPEKLLQASVDSFNSSQSLVTVNMVHKGDYNALRTAVLASLANGQPPDMAQCYENHASKYVQSDALAEMTPFINAKDGVASADQKDIFANLLQDGQINGKQYMYPVNKSTTVIYYNADMLKAKGINNPPATWDELFADAHAVTDKNAGIFGVATPAYDTWVGMLYENGGTLYDNDKKPGKAAFNGTVGQALTQKWRDAVASGDAKIQTGSGFPDQVSFQNQKSAFYIGSIASYTFLVTGVAGKFVFHEAPFPSGPKGTLDPLFGTNACIFKKASQDVQHGAFLFLKYFNSKDQQVAWSKASGYMPNSQAAYKQLQSDVYGSNPDLAVGVGMLAKGQLFEEAPTPSSDDQRTAISTELVNAFGGNKPVKQALDDAATKVNDLLTTG